MPIVIEPPEAPPLDPPKDDGSNVWEALYEALGFHRGPDGGHDFALRIFCEGWCSTLQPVHDLVREREDGPAWAILFDVDLCPAESLPYLAQYVGVLVTPEMTEAQLREELREPTGWARGRIPSIRLAGQRTLTGTRRVIIRPREPEVGRHYIRTLKSETPDEARTEARIRAAVPAWEVLDYAAIDGVDWVDIDAGYEDWDEVAATFTDWDDLEDTLPSELPE